MPVQVLYFLTGFALSELRHIHYHGGLNECKRAGGDFNKVRPLHKNQDVMDSIKDMFRQTAFLYKSFEGFFSKKSFKK